MAILFPDPGAEAPADAVVAVPQHRRNRFPALARLLRSRIAVASMAFLLLIVLLAILAPLIAKHDPNTQTLTAINQNPSGDHWLGTDHIGRDIFSRLLHGSRVSLLAGVEACGLAVLIGVPIGAIAGYAGKGIDAFISVWANAVMSIPPLLLAFAIVGVLGIGLTNAMVAVGVTLSPRFFRLSRAATASVRTEQYIEGARASGCSAYRLLWRHVLPNISGPLIVQASFSIATAIVAEASLSYLGLGVRAPQSSWGSLLQDAFENVYSDWWPIIPPSVAMFLTILALSLLGDSLRDASGRGSEGK